MQMQKSIAKRLAPFGVMLCGAAFVLGLVLVMNTEVERPSGLEPKLSQAVTVVPESRPPRRPPKADRTRARTPKTTERLSSPQPVMSSSLGALAGVALELPGLSDRLLSEGSRRLKGAEAAKNMVMTEESVDNPPRPVDRTAPVYPPRARSQGVTGFVSLSLLIGADGRIESVKVLESAPTGVFEDRAVEAVRQWHFEPAIYKGERVRVWARQVVRFDLS